jgi:hypothetical protein
MRCIWDKNDIKPGIAVAKPTNGGVMPYHQPELIAYRYSTEGDCSKRLGLVSMADGLFITPVGDGSDPELLAKHLTDEGYVPVSKAFCKYGPTMPENRLGLPEIIITGGAP